MQSALIALSIGFAAAVAGLVFFIVKYTKLAKDLKNQELLNAEIEETKKKINDLYNNLSSNLTKTFSDANASVNNQVTSFNQLSANLQSFVQNSINQAISGTTGFTTQEIQNIKNTVAGVIQEELNNIQKISEDVKINSIGMMNRVSQDINSKALEEINKFHQTTQNQIASTSEALRNIVTASQQSITKSLEVERSAIKQEMVEYKKVKMAEVEKNISDMVKTIAKEVLGKSINLTAQQEEIRKALNDAKQKRLL